MATVRLDGMLRGYVSSLHLSSAARTVKGVLDDLDGRYPRLKGRIRNEAGAVRPFVRIFVNGTALKGTEALGTRLGAGDTVDILHSIQGG